ncbi:Double-strand-break repair protein rad21 [Phytophthora cinnamomi]|uniref:Double-strand-break repair protein rad21 n=1 Tax=Phytophthora cinnamomi TaxID=4785 RepID=UPI00355AC6A8|nr:Double-strand-break repair protein rad21 [Phytophthora cinnamomi]
MGCAQSKTEDVAATNPPEAEPAAAEPVAIEEPAASPVAAEEPAPAAAEPEAETAAPEEPAAPETPAKDLFKVTGHEIDEAGVVFYTVEAVEGDATFKKRFSDFKTLVVALGSPKSLPALPGSGLGSKLRGKHNPELIAERETKLALVLNAIANDGALADNDAFKKFVQ